ncbi:MAG: copper amine oxidase N-terminal domain-containing protein [Caldisericia bacterium]
MSGDKGIRIISQAPKGLCSSFAIALSGKPKSVTSTTTTKWVYQNGILIVSFVSSGPDGFVISTSEGVDLSAINLSIQPAKPEENSICTILSTVYNPTGIPSGEYTVYYYWDELKRESLFKTIVNPSISPSGYEYINFSAPVYLVPGKHKLYMHISISDEVNVTNNTKMLEFEVAKTPTYKTITLRIDSKDAFVNGVLSILDSPPIISNGRTMVPFRFLAESLGATVEWNDFDKRVTFIKDDKLMYLWIGKESAIINSQMVELDAAPIIRNGRTLVPLRVISENLGAEVAWDGQTRTVTIKMEMAGESQ